ncbi:MAG: biotin/lipoyl-binding protein [Chloroflexi bacterium]|nr:biotin/lipoyl-binding protein [Chloroflexota bacterium]
MKYYVHVGDQNYEVEITGEPDELPAVRIDGEAVTADLVSVGKTGLYSLLLEGASYELLADFRDTDCEVVLGGEVYHAQVKDERTRLLDLLAPKDRALEGETPVKAPMPGLVKDVAVAPGDAVKAGQRLVILEAMKMENELRAPADGTVKSVNVTAGEAVEQGRLLLVLE